MPLRTCLLSYHLNSLSHSGWNSISPSLSLSPFYTFVIILRLTSCSLTLFGIFFASPTGRLGQIHDGSAHHRQPYVAWAFVCVSFSNAFFCHFCEFFHFFCSVVAAAAAAVALNSPVCSIQQQNLSHSISIFSVIHPPHSTLFASILLLLVVVLSSSFIRLFIQFSHRCCAFDSLPPSLFPPDSICQQTYITAFWQPYTKSKL